MKRKITSCVAENTRSKKPCLLSPLRRQKDPWVSASMLHNYMINDTLSDWLNNYGKRERLTINGVNVGKTLTNHFPEINSNNIPGDGSIIVIIATNAPLLPHQLKKLARRSSLGIGNVGGIGANGSGDIFLAFSTSNKDAFSRKNISDIQMISNDMIDPFLQAVVESTEESIINSLFAAETMTGINNNKVYELPINRLKELLN